MTTAITKESLAARIADLEYGPRSLKEDYTLAAYKMLLATMEAEPVAWTSEEAIEEVYYGETGMIGPKHLVGDVPLYRHAQPAPECEQLAIENFRSAMEGIGHIRRTLEETFGGLHGTHVEPDVLAECKAICDAIYAAYGHVQPAPVVPDEVRRCLNFFASVIKSGEQWTSVCQHEYDTALVSMLNQK